MNSKHMQIQSWRETGSEKLYTKSGVLALGFLVILIGLAFTSSFQFIVTPIIVGSLFGIAYIKWVMHKPKVAINTLFLLSFFVVGLTRFVSLPFGLAVDGLLMLAWISLLFKGFKWVNWSSLNNSLIYGTLVWMLYCGFQIFNPLAPNIIAWFYAVRGLALYGVLLIPLLFLLYNKQKDFKFFIDVWFTISILAGLYGAKQYWFGLFDFEQAWLDNGGAVTHVLWGEFVRMFSFASDANQFGSSQAHVATLAIIFAISEENKRRKLFFYITAIVSFYGMFISGTRGAIVIPIVGLATYLLLARNYKVFLLGSLIGSVLLYLLVYTYVLHDVEPVRRMRSAFSATKDASFQVRMENRAMLDDYLIDKPFGGGIGSAGVWGQRFSPDSFLARFETDGHYVRIQAETGNIGLYLYYLIHVIIIGRMLWIVWSIKSNKLRNRMSGLACGVIALMVANYSAAVTVALPSSVIVLWSMAFVYMSKDWDREEEYPINELPSSSKLNLKTTTRF